MSIVTNYVPKSTSWDNTLYNYANETMAKSLKEYQEGHVAKSWALTIPVRLAFLADAITSLVLIPFTAIASFFTLFYGLVDWDWTLCKDCWGKTVEKTHHFFLGLLGGVLSPNLAYRIKDNERLVIMGGITALKLAAAGCLLLSGSLSRIGFDSNGDFFFSFDV